MQRFQYRIVQLGMFNTAARMATALGQLGRDGWELTTVYDKSSNWLTGMEKGFALFKRPAEGDIADDQWCVIVRPAALAPTGAVDDGAVSTAETRKSRPADQGSEGRREGW